MKRTDDGGTDWIDETFTVARMFTVIIVVKFECPADERQQNS